MTEIQAGGITTPTPPPPPPLPPQQQQKALYFLRLGAAHNRMGRGQREAPPIPFTSFLPPPPTPSPPPPDPLEGEEGTAHSNASDDEEDNDDYGRNLQQEDALREEDNFLAIRQARGISLAWQPGDCGYVRKEERPEEYSNLHTDAHRTSTPTAEETHTNTAEESPHAPQVGTQEIPIGGAARALWHHLATWWSNPPDTEAISGVATTHMTSPELEGQEDQAPEPEPRQAPDPLPSPIGGAMRALWRHLQTWTRTDAAPAPLPSPTPPREPHNRRTRTRIPARQDRTGNLRRRIYPPPPCPWGARRGRASLLQTGGPRPPTADFMPRSGWKGVNPIPPAGIG
jgi:hypothetical protein